MKKKKIVSLIKKHTPASLNARLALLSYLIKGRPTVRSSEKVGFPLFPDNSKGGLILSADFELAWAFRYSKRIKDPISLALHERNNVPILIELFEKYQIPITWATVGHLFLKSCRKDSHNHLQRIPHFDAHWKFTSGDWYDHDPHTDYVSDPAWYAPDLIDMILNSNVKHEVACHTFSHLDCSDAHCPPQVLDDEIVEWNKLAGSKGVELCSLVFPGGTYGNYDVLVKHGVKIYRKSTKYELSYPYYDENGLLVTCSTSSFGKSYEWTAEQYIKRYNYMIDKAIKTGTIAHIWFHPSLDSWTLQKVMPSVLLYASKLRTKGDLWIGTMEQIANHINRNASWQG